MRIVPDMLVTVAELLEHHERKCGIPGPSFSRCMRGERHLAPCGALGTDTEGVPIVVTWYPAGAFPISRGVDPGA